MPELMTQTQLVKFPVEVEMVTRWLPAVEKCHSCARKSMCQLSCESADVQDSCGRNGETRSGEAEEHTHTDFRA